MKKERQPESGELVWDIWVEKRQQTTHIIHTSHLEEERERRKTVRACRSTATLWTKMKVLNSVQSPSARSALQPAVVQSVNT